MLRRNSLLGVLLIYLVVGCSTNVNKNTSSRVITPFDKDWKFMKSDVDGAQSPNFDDEDWRTLNVPHDWSIAGYYDSTHSTGHGGGYLPSGIGCYRKSFSLDKELDNK